MTSASYQTVRRSTGRLYCWRVAHPPTSFAGVWRVPVFCCCRGVLLFNWYKLRRLRQQLRQRIHSKDGSLDLDLDDTCEGQSAAAVIVANGSGSSPSHHMEGVRRLVSAEGGSGSRSLSPAELHGCNGLHNFTKRKSGVQQAAEEEQLSAEELQNLEFEPLLPLPSGVMVRR